MTQWISTNADEHVLCDDRGLPSEYRVRRDPVTGCYHAYDGELRIREHMAIYSCQRVCEERYKAERQQPSKARELQGSRPGNAAWKALA